MKPEKQIKAILELDGCKLTPNGDEKGAILVKYKGDKFNVFPDELDSTLAHMYDQLLTSYDAIIPVIQKQNLLIMTEVGIQLQILWKKSGKGIPTSNNTEGWIAWTLITTPSQLCEALLRATGKWTDK